MLAREVALNALIACRKDGAWPNSVLKSQIARGNLDKRDAGLATRLCYGVLQNRGALDFYLKQLLKGKLRNLHPAVRDILHLGLYQLLFMDKIPVSAAVNESVALAKKFCKGNSSAPAVINGVLRNALRQSEALEQPSTLEDKYSHPRGLIELFRGYLGDEYLEAMLQANNEAPETVIQVNTQKVTKQTLLEHLAQEGVTAHSHPWMENCLILGATGNLEKLKCFAAGEFYVQDAASKLAVEWVGLTPEPLTVVDCCAAPGGKSFAAAMALAGKGKIYSLDLHPHRVELIKKGAQRLGLDGITAAQRDAAQPWQEMAGKVDVALVDVPCSGYGIIRKKPDIRYKDPDSMKQLPQLQLEILENQAKLVKPGGVLLYSTCTLVRRENEGVVEKFLKTHPEFCLAPRPLPEVFPQGNNGMLRLLPGQYHTDGFFICRMERK